MPRVVRVLAVSESRWPIYWEILAEAIDQIGAVIESLHVDDRGKSRSPSLPFMATVQRRVGIQFMHEDLCMGLMTASPGCLRDIKGAS